MEISNEVETLLNKMALFAHKHRHEYVTPEHLLYILTDEFLFAESFRRCGGNISLLKENLENYLKENLEILDQKVEQIQLSIGLNQVLMFAEERSISCGKCKIEIPHLISGILSLKESYAAYYLLSQNIDAVALLSELSTVQLEQEDLLRDSSKQDTFIEEETSEERHRKILAQFTTCLNEEVDKKNPLIGREAELERTIQILCRRYKNNPLHLGEPGVGKTAITYGLAERINKGNVPNNLKDAKIYAVDLGAILAGAQFRGDFEKRFQTLMNEVKKETNPILYFDEIHNLVGAGAVGGSSLDASNLLKPYLTDGSIRFIGATTYEEYKKYFSKSKSMVRRFQNIDIKEPTFEETVTILNGLKKHYEQFHHVRYGKGTMEHAVLLSDKYINERYLPDKAIDLIDEAGAYRVMHPKQQKVQSIDKELLEEVLSKICNLPKKAVESDELKQLSCLEINLQEKIFGQDEALNQLANAVKFAKAGLNEENKPLGSLLFAGPTGVGKTESAKCLSELLNIPLIRFDMSEYAEKHTVAKLIGSPAGYVGYEEGGLLTETIRKHPYCILLLDEIEKAHNDIYNVLLQVMDYATLTDNQGRKADFRNVILIMTSNAGARNIGKLSIGFSEEEIGEEAVLEEVKRVFSPEFRNRLDRIITFHSMNQDMANKIVEKQLHLLSQKLLSKKIELFATSSLKNHLKEHGISKEYGAREINRLIHSEIKPLLVDEILFGKLKKGGHCTIDYQDNKVLLEFTKNKVLK